MLSATSPGFTVGACALGCVLCALASATLYAGEADLLLDGLGLIHRPGVLCRIDSWGLALSSVTLTGIIGLVMMISFAYMAFAVICARLRFKASAGDAHANPTAAAARGAAFEVLPGATGGRARECRDEGGGEQLSIGDLDDTPPPQPKKKAGAPGER